MFKPRTVAIATVALCGGIASLNMMKDFKTPGVKNIEDRFTAAGGAPSHTPARASKLGSEEHVEGGQVGEKGVGSKQWRETHGEMKAPSNAIGKKWNQTMNDSDTSRQGGP